MTTNIIPWFRTSDLMGSLFVVNEISWFGGQIGSTNKVLLYSYRSADKSLAGPRRKQATATEHFDVHISYL